MPVPQPLILPYLTQVLRKCLLLRSIGSSKVTRLAEEKSNPLVDPHRCESQALVPRLTYDWGFFRRHRLRSEAYILSGLHSNLPRVSWTGNLVRHLSHSRPPLALRWKCPRKRNRVCQFPSFLTPFAAHFQTDQAPAKISPILCTDPNRPSLLQSA